MRRRWKTQIDELIRLHTDAIEELVIDLGAMAADLNNEVRNLNTEVVDDSDTCNARHEWTSGVLQGTSDRIHAVEAKVANIAID
jgi:hypothetical protein